MNKDWNYLLYNNNNKDLYLYTNNFSNYLYFYLKNYIFYVKDNPIQVLYKTYL